MLFSARTAIIIVVTVMTIAVKWSRCDDDDDDNDDDDDDDDDDVGLYSAVTPCYCSLLGALGRVVSFETCC